MAIAYASVYMGIACAGMYSYEFAVLCSDLLVGECCVLDISRLSSEKNKKRAAFPGNFPPLWPPSLREKRGEKPDCVSLHLSG